MPRQRYILILAANIAEANTYAKRAGLPRFTYRAVEKASSIRGIQVADVHVLPSFETRRDKHAINAELRHGRDIVRIDVEMPEPLEEPAVDQGDGMGQQLTIDDLVERDLRERDPILRGHKSVDPAIELVQGFENYVESVAVETTSPKDRVYLTEDGPIPIEPMTPSTDDYPVSKPSPKAAPVKRSPKPKKSPAAVQRPAPAAAGSERIF